MSVRIWSEAYRRKRRSIEEAVCTIRSGQRIFIGTACGEPQALVRELLRQSGRLADVEIIQLYSQGVDPFSLLAGETQADGFTLRSFYLGSAKSDKPAEHKRFFTPVPLSAIPRLFHNRLIPLQVALIQVSPPDDTGRMSLGIAVDVTLSATRAAEKVIAQVNPRMPRVGGRSFVHVEEVDMVVEEEEELLTVKPFPSEEVAPAIGRQAASLIEDGSTVQLGLGIVPHAAQWALEGKKDLGIHTPFLTDDILHLLRRGVITNRRKEIHAGKLIASGAVGSRELYDFLNENPAVEFYPSDYVCDPLLIARHPCMVALNGAAAVDLTGQVAAEALPHTHYAGISEMLDFIRGASAAKKGRSILLLPSTNKEGKSSRIVASLQGEAVVVPRGEVQFVVTEFGTANLFGKTLEERALALIGIAHPDFRAPLFEEAKVLGLIGKERTRPPSICKVYPRELEEQREIAGVQVLFRPVKPTDERLIQEHFYRMDPEDISARFLQERMIFPRRDLVGIIHVDYINELTLIAVIGEPGFEQVIGVGGYFQVPTRNAVEAAFSVLKPWQRKGIGTILLRKLARAAEEKGASTFFVYTQPQNQGMIRLFRKMPHPVTSTYEEDMLLLICRLEEKP